VSDVLERICADTRIETARRQQSVPLAALESKIKSATPVRGFRRRLESAGASGRPALIAEIKKASPSRGLIRPDFDPASLARAYKDGGAACLSVLTDGPYFQGSAEHLMGARAAVDLPVIRKDFMLESYQVYEARAMGADCILVIMAALDDTTARELTATATKLGMDALIEVHDRDELERALTLDAGLVGINNRNLKTLTIDLKTFEDLAPLVPKDRLLVAESGLKTPADLARLTRAGARAFLVGESLMSQRDVTAATRALLAPIAVPA
jgi:indole-3-glycerol phosphate synthase